MFWQTHPLVRLVLPFIAGMAGANFFIEYLVGRQTVLFAIAAVLAFLLYILYTGVRRPNRDQLFGLTASLLMATIGTWLYVEKYEAMETVGLTEGKEYGGVVAQAPVEKDKTWAVEIETGEGQLLGHFAKDSLHSPSMLHPGDSVWFTPRHLRLTSPRLAAADSTNAGFLFYYRYLFFKGIRATAYVPSNAWQQTGKAGGSFSLLHVFADVRQQMHLAYAEAGLDDEAGSVIEAMTTGNRSVLSSDLRQAYVRSGVAHVLALSGFHLGLLLMMFNLLVQNFCTLRWRRIVSFCFIPMIWAFCLLAGMPSSLVRATIMCSIVQVSLIVGRPDNMLNGCALAAFLMLVVNPLLLQDVGFQLSFLAIVGIAASTPRLFDINTQSHKIKTFLLNTLLVSVAYSLVTFPLVAYHFGQVPLLGILTNLLITLLVPLLMFGALTWWILYVLGIRWLLLAGGLATLAGWMNTLASAISTLPFATISFRPTIPEVLTLYLLIGSLWYYAYHRTALPLKLALSSLILFCSLLLIR